MKNSLSKTCETIRVSNAVAAGTTDINSDAVNMANAQGVLFQVHFGTITAGAVTSIKIQQSSDDGSADAYSDVAGTAVTVADTDDNKIAVTEILRPLKQYVRCVVDRGTQNAVVDSIVAIRHGLRKQPKTAGSTIAGTTVTVGPAEGTA